LTPPRFSVGGPVQLHVVARDAFNNTALSYAGTVHFTSTDGTAALPGKLAAAFGSSGFGTALNVLGNMTITATDVVTPSINGTSASILVAVAPLPHGHDDAGADDNEEVQEGPQAEARQVREEEEVMKPRRRALLACLIATVLASRPHPPPRAAPPI